MGSKDDHLQEPTGDRIRTLTTTQSKARELRAGSGGHELGQLQHECMGAAQAVLEQWPSAPKKVGTTILGHSGPPNELTPTEMFWYRNAPWSRMELTADEILHDFPTSHTDFPTSTSITTSTRARPPSSSTSTATSSSDRTTGAIHARCDHEAYDTLTLNLAVEILQGRRTVERPPLLRRDRRRGRHES